MECQECKQNPATVHFAQVINGEKTEVHVCQQCAMEKGYVSQEDDAYSLHHLLSGLFNPKSDETHQQSHKTQETDLQCDKCGMTYQQFAKIGKFGCASCYHTFAEHLNPLFRKVHSGNTAHEGKVPKRVGSDIYQRKKLRDLKVTLQQAIAEEAFEDAAEIRDEIRSLEKDLNRYEERDES
ncbi:Protein-arginine kinase activator protein McsA [Gracilibacillus orientalis]|uniref:Protein-arginine kinase activator protein McsA n=1 Tax=Gracilibacillus orientalis TaxID=334253 RepID=A0A1I4RFF7_9BACI|nr:UvrB/UvrC motif-containing protein [Gracilibacillus orientalis]SFM51014.1 Protein-arginine kinase activator protein McsA [Gracilibacillus orientalis]